MRRTRTVVWVTVSLILSLTGCSRAIDGSAEGDLHPPLVQITKDAFGIRTGLAAAPVQLELFTEPQCSHCADLQRDFGDQFAYYIGTGRLALTYRPMTFLADAATQGHSGRVVNAMFTAATPGGAEGTTSITGRQFQHFVEQLWANQQPGTPGPANQELADLARTARLPELQSTQIANGAIAKSEDDLLQLETTNFEFLFEIDPLRTGTPTIFDLKKGRKLDIYDDDWLSKVMEP